VRGLDGERLGEVNVSVDVFGVLEKELDSAVV
jgi:hypothetical protein